MTLLAVFTPLLNFILMTFFTGRLVTWRHTSTVVIVNMLFLLVTLLFAFPRIVGGETYVSTLGNWLTSSLFEVNWTFSIDAITYVMLLVVLTVSTLVHIYSTEYMSEDPHTSRFISYLSLFTFFMLLLVTSNNFVGLFLGWEGVGLCSYLLISFWFTRVQANKAAIKAMVVNRVADLFFTVGIVATYYVFQSVEFNTVFGLAPYLTESTLLLGTLEINPLVLIVGLLFLGAMGKSAQIGLHTWLPDAMEGPTPVSALIHAATMVTAGVFLLIRCSPLLTCTPSMLTVITVIGAGTAFMAATSGIFQNDLKKVIAYSTCSQLGYMVFVCGLSGYAVSLFHLSTHAFFKALLFLGAGAVIHAVVSEQDMRRFGGLLKLLPYTYAAFLVGSLALMGIPFLSGFYSKDFILELAGSSLLPEANFAYMLGLVSALFTSYYSFRLLYLTFYGASRTERAPLEHTHELSARMAFALFVLTIGSVFLGVYGKDLFIGFGTDTWGGVISSPSYLSLYHVSAEVLPVHIKLTPLYLSVTAVAAVFLIFISSVNSQPMFLDTTARQGHYFLTHKWCFDDVYNSFVNKPLLQGAYNGPFKAIDKGLLELFGPMGLSTLVRYMGAILVGAQTGRAYDYAGALLAALYIILIFTSCQIFSVFAILPYTVVCLFPSAENGLYSSGPLP